jgi:hypothetical protein
MARTFDAPEPNEETGKKLRKFFTDLLDDTNLRTYHEDPATYVKTQQEAGVLDEAAAGVILNGNLQDIDANIKLVTGSGHAVPVCIVMPPM